MNAYVDRQKTSATQAPEIEWTLQEVTNVVATKGSRMSEMKDVQVSKSQSLSFFTLISNQGFDHLSILRKKRTNGFLMP